MPGVHTTLSETPGFLAAGFIASHLAKRLKSEGHYIVACDWKRNEHMPVRLPPMRVDPLCLRLSAEAKVVYFRA